MKAYKDKLPIEDSISKLQDTIFALQVLKEFGFTEVYAPNFLLFVKEIRKNPAERRVSAWLETVVKYFRPMSIQEATIQLFEMDYMPEDTRLNPWCAQDRVVKQEEELQ